MKSFWASYEIRGGSICTWNSDAADVEEFIDQLLINDIREITRFIEIEQQISEWPSKPNIRIPIAKYNKFLKDRLNIIVMEVTGPFNSEVKLILRSYSMDALDNICLSSDCVSYFPSL